MIGADESRFTPTAGIGGASPETHGRAETCPPRWACGQDWMWGDSQACLLWLTHSWQSDDSLFFFNVQVANGYAKGINSGPPLGYIPMYIELKRDCIFQENRIAVTISPQCLPFRYYPLLQTGRVSRWMNAVYLQITHHSARVLHVSGPRRIEQTDMGVIFQWKGAKI